ncbi:unnamed protein product, partial [Bubo scandiacus]
MLDHALWLHIRKGPGSSRFTSATMNDVYAFVYKHEPGTEGRARAKGREHKAAFCSTFSEALQCSGGWTLGYESKGKGSQCIEKQLYPFKMLQAIFKFSAPILQECGFTLTQTYNAQHLFTASTYSLPDGQMIVPGTMGCNPIL